MAAVTTTVIKAQARELGFDLCGIAAAELFPELQRLEAWLERGYAGEMRYMERSAATRADVRRVLASARSVIMVGAVYDAHDESLVPEGRARIARYARSDDYHEVISARLQALVDWLRDRHAEPFEAVIFSDKEPVQERAYAARAGLGWVGKNTCLIDPALGSWLLLGGVATNLELAPDAPVGDLCGDCTLCLDACPTGALVDARELDARRCISYLTIEVTGAIPEEHRAAIADHVWGCDICQEVCPYNLAPVEASLDGLRARADRTGARLAELWQASDAELRAFVAGSAMTYRSLSRMRRNLAVAIGNAAGLEDAGALLDAAGGSRTQPAQSADTPLVRDHVAWARARAAARRAER